MLPPARPAQTTPPNPPESLPASAGGTPTLPQGVQFTPQQQPVHNSHSLPAPPSQPQAQGPPAPPPAHAQPISIQKQQLQHQHQQQQSHHHHQHQQQQQQIPRSTSAPRFTHRRRGADPALSSEGGVRARHTSHTQSPSGGSIPVPPLPGNGPQVQGVQRRQGKPIFEWFKGKLGARRGSDADQQRRDAAFAAANNGGGNGNGSNNGKRVLSSKALPPTPIIHLGYRQDMPLAPAGPLSPNSIMTRNSEDSGIAFRRTESMSVRSHSMSSSYIPTERRRELNNPYPSLPIPLVRRSYPASTIDTESRHASMSVLSRSRTSSLGSLSSHPRRPQISIADHTLTHESLPNSASGLCADDDASVRPLPPSPSRSMSIISKFGSEALVHSDSFTRRVPTSPPPSDRRDTYSSVGAATSITSDDMGGRSRQNSLASTKPTTVMSFDSNGPPVAHIAVAATTSTSSSPIVIQSTSPPGPSSAAPSLSSPVSATFPPPPGPPPDEMRVPRHTRYHPRNNPHPSSPPAADASTVTLASSTFALGTDRAQRPNSTRSPAAVLHGTSPASHNPVSPTVAFADAPGSMYDGVSTHALSFNARSRGYGRCDDDASMRAIRRRGSWESAESRWSWRPGTESAGVFAALGRGSVSHADSTEETAATNRNSTQTRESFRTAYSAWTQPEAETGEHTLTSEPSLVSHRPVSVRV